MRPFRLLNYDVAQLMRLLSSAVLNACHLMQQQVML